MEIHFSTEDSARSGINYNMNASRSLIIFFLYYIVQFLTGLLAGVLISLFFIILTGHRPDDQQFTSFVGRLDPYILLSSTIVSAVFLLMLVKHYSSSLITDRSPAGIALYSGKKYEIFLAFLAGIVIALVYAVATNIIFPPDPGTKFGPITEMAFSNITSRIIWLIIALILAPPIEEFLFRGVLFSGFTFSFGIYVSAFLTTAIFVLVHISEYINYPPALAGILAIAVFTVIMRIRTRALGPCIAAHFGYNLFIAALLLKLI